MKVTSTLLIALAIVFVLAAPARAQSATSESELQLGVDAYKNSHYDEAIQHFQKAVDLDSSNLRDRMYLATAYVSQFIPGVETPENIRMAEEAAEQYQQVLASNVGRDYRINSAKGIAYLYLNMKKFEDSKTYYQMASDLDPTDPEAVYSLGVIDWTECYQPRMEARARLGLRPEQNLDARNANQKKVCDELRVKNTSAVEHGIETLKKAIELRPDYDDAMAYLNLMYREKADLECDDPGARSEDLKTADEWVDKTLAIKKAKAEKAQEQNSATAPSPQ